MFICLNQICGYTDLCQDAEQLRKEPYSSDNASHEKRLMQVTQMIKNILLLFIEFQNTRLVERINGLDSVLWL